MLHLNKRSSPESERGSSLLAVVGLMAVFAIIAVTIVGSTMSAIGVSSSTQAGVQAQAAAEAGIDATVAGLATTKCADVVLDSTLAAADLRSASEYSVDLFFQVSAGGDWSAGCAPDRASKIRIVSTGTADAALTTASSRTVEAVYAIEKKGGSGPSGISIYAYSDLKLTESAGISKVGAFSTAYAYFGPTDCASSGAQYADFIVAEGDVTLTKSCGVFGDVWASQAAVLGESAIAHEPLTAASLTMSASAIIGNAGDTGNTAWIGGAAVLSGGNVIYGKLTADTVTNASRVDHGVTTPSGQMPPPVSGLADPGWFELNYKYSNNKNKARVQSPKDQQHWKSFEDVYRITGVCGMAELQAAAVSLAGAPGLIECEAGVDVTGPGVLTLSSDIAIVAEHFSFVGGDAGLVIDSSSPHRLWMITPDHQPNDKPKKCSQKKGCDTFAARGLITVGTNVSAMVYTPFGVNIGTSGIWRGQITGGSVHLGMSTVFHYAPVGFPDATATVGGGAGGTTAGMTTLGTRESIRDMND